VSYGREPYYIFRTDYQSGTKFSVLGEDVDLVIPYDALAQLVWSMSQRNNGEMEALLKRGAEVRGRNNGT
jgi:hypothetical protein